MGAQSFVKAFCPAHSKLPELPFLGIAMKFALAAMLVCSAGAMELTKDNWDSAVAGKSVFVKFLAPW